MNSLAAAGLAARSARGGALALALQASRADTLARFDTLSAALAQAGRTVPQDPQFNPLLWELGHIGWFQTWWTSRNPALGAGLHADPDVPRSTTAADSSADALYDSSRVPHATRWDLSLPDAAQSRATLAAQLQAALELLTRQTDDDASLYFHRLALLHEDMHHEAALTLAQALGLGLGLPAADMRWQPQPLDFRRETLPVAASQFDQGLPTTGGFAFDNECGQHARSLPAYGIDNRVVTWADYLPFVHAHDCRAELMPRYVRRRQAGDDEWEVQRWGRWQALDPKLPACHLTWQQANAWCQWAGRRLPSESEWEYAAISLEADFHWGAVWEWTASPFAPYPGFQAHPYRDYSAPWFDGRPVLRGASFATQPRLHHPRYRNFFPASRSDIFAGFRSCAA